MAHFFKKKTMPENSSFYHSLSYQQGKGVVRHSIVNLFFFISVFSIQLPMTGFKLRIIGIGSDLSTNCATTTANLMCIICLAILYFNGNRPQLVSRWYLWIFNHRYALAENTLLSTCKLGQFHFSIFDEHYLPIR